MRFLASVDTSPLHPVGPVDERMQTVYTPIFWTSVVVFVLVSGAIVYAALRFRRKSDDEEPVQVHGNNRLELGWTLLPFAILVALFGITVANMHFITTAPDNSMHVHVMAQRYSWSYTYEDETGPDSKPLFVGGTLTVPVGVPVALTLDSKDVNHSFYIPSIAGQVNAVPGQTNHLWFQIDHAGQYIGACTELCGEGHWQMVVKITALEQPAFDAWLQQEKNPSSATTASTSSSTSSPSSAAASPSPGATASPATGAQATPTSGSNNQSPATSAQPSP